MKTAGDRLRRSGPSTGRLTATIPPKALTGIACERPLEGLGERSAPSADAARVVVLDDDAGGLGELGRQCERGVGVEQVVVGQLLAVELGCRRRRRGRRRRST